MSERLVSDLVGALVGATAKPSDTATPFAIVPPEYFALDLSEYGEAPPRVKEIREFLSMESFTEYVNRFADDATTIFGKPANSVVLAIIDYHTTADSPRWGDHRAALQLQTHPDWKALKGNNNRLIQQVAFAEFVEDHLRVFIDPAAAAMLEVAQRFEVKRDVTYKSAHRLDTGAMELEYVQKDQKVGKIEVPTKVKIVCPVFEFGEPVSMTLRLRTRIQETTVSFQYLIDDLDKIELDAFIAVCDTVKTACKRSVLI